jgi:peptide chain release factor 1
MQKLPSIEPYRRRIEELEGIFGLGEVYQDPRKAADLSREHLKVKTIVGLSDRLQEIEKELVENRQMLAAGELDAEMRDLVRVEIESLENERLEKHRQLLVEMVPPDPSDDRNTVMEIRGGAGGDEASIFAADLYRMYCRYAESQGWQVENLGSNPSESGGYREVSFLIKGDQVYKRLKFESGVHRVQRIPVTETNGRIHTSTATVAVLPEAEEVDIAIAPGDLEITVCRASGPGGQSVNTTDSAVQVMHKPTGMIVTCADEKSQHKNKAKALMVLRSRLLQQKQDEERAKYAAQRKQQVGSGDRSERIRTYNFPQSRVTDHRIGLTLHSLDQVMDGEIDDLVKALETADVDLKLQEIDQNGGM